MCICQLLDKIYRMVENLVWVQKLNPSTQKLHARGPMGLREMTTMKYLICGDGQIR